MKRLALVGLLVSGCARPSVPSISLADVAGVWDVAAKLEGSDTVTTRYVLTATADTGGWKIEFPAPAKPLYPRILSVVGDSIVTRTGPYPSTLRPGVFVVTEGVFRLQNGKLIGRSIAHYTVSTPDSVRRINTEGIRR